MATSGERARRRTGRVGRCARLATAMVMVAPVVVSLGLAIADPAGVRAAGDLLVNSAATGADDAPGDGRCSTGRVLDGEAECTLRAAIEESNALAALQTVLVPPGLYAEAAPITDEIVVRGTVARDAEIRVLLVVENAASVTIEQATLVGGIVSSGATRVDRVLLRDVIVEPVNPSLTLEVRTDVLRLEDSTVAPRVSNTSTRLGAADRVEFVGSLLQDLVVSAFDEVLVERSSFVGESQLFSGGSFEIDRSYFEVGGPIAVNVASTGSLTMTNSTVIANRPISVAFDASATIDFSTVVGQQYGVFPNSGSTVSITGSAILNEGAGVACAGAVVSAASAASDDTCGAGALANVDPLLGAVGDNGGDTPTRVPAAGSPLIDAAGGVTCPANDQRGRFRPVDGDGDRVAICDIGAVEVGVTTEVDVRASFASTASERHTIRLDIEFPGSISVVQTERFDIDEAWPYASDNECAGETSDFYFEFRRFTCSGRFAVQHTGDVILVPVPVIQGSSELVLYDGDCSQTTAGAIVDLSVENPSCELTIVGAETDGDAALHLTEQWIGDSSVAGSPEILLRSGSGTDLRIFARAAIPTEVCPPPPMTQPEAVSFEQCVDALGSCEESVLGCEQFWGLEAGSGTDLDIDVGAVDGWTTFFGGDCGLAGELPDVREGDLVRCDIVHVQGIGANGMVVDWAIDYDDGVFGPLGPSRTIDVEVELSVAGDPLESTGTDDALPQQNRPHIDCTAPDLATDDVPILCRSVLPADAGTYELALDNRSGPWDLVASPPCSAPTIDIVAGGFTRCAMALDAQPPAFRLDPTPRVVVEGTSPTPTRVAIPLTFPTPTPPGYALETQILTHSAYGETAGALGIHTATIDFDGASGFESLPTGTTEHLVWVDITADGSADAHPEEGFIIQVEEHTTSQFVRVHVTIVDDDVDPVVTEVIAGDDDEPAPLITEFAAVVAAGAVTGYEWTLHPSGRTWSTTEPVLADIVLTDIGVNTMTVVASNDQGATSDPVSVDVTVEPTTLQIPPIAVVEGDLDGAAPAEPWDVLGELRRELFLDVVVAGESDPGPTIERPVVDEACGPDVDVAILETSVEVGRGTNELPILVCPDDVPERDWWIDVDLVEPETGATIVTARLEVTDDDRYALSPVVVDEGGVLLDPTLAAIETVRQVDTVMSPWYTEPPARIRLVGPTGPPGICSPGGFVTGPEVGLRTGASTITDAILPAGVPVELVVCGDAVPELDLVLELVVEAPDGSVDRTTVTVVDDDAAPAVSSVPLRFDEETSGVRIVAVAVDPEPFDRQVGVQWLPVAGGAVAGPCLPNLPSDFGLLTVPYVVIEANSPTLTTTLEVCADSLTDRDGDLELVISRIPTTIEQLAKPVVVGVVPATIVGVGAPTIEVIGTTVVEGADGDGVVAEVVIAATGIGATSVQYETASGGPGAPVPAVAGDDFEPVSGEVSGALPWNRTIRIPILGDDIVEGDHAFRLRVSSPDTVISTTTADVVIVDDDELGLAIDAVSVDEGALASTTIRLVNPVEQAMSVAWETVAGTASAGDDFVGANDSVQFDPGELSRTIAVQTVVDSRIERNETFEVVASAAGGAAATGTITIVEDSPPTLSRVDDITVSVPIGTVRPVPVTWQLRADDDRDGQLPVTCIPSSGSGFPIGTSTVGCTAADSGGHVVSATFDVLVGTAAGTFAGSGRTAAPGTPPFTFTRGETVNLVSGGFDPNGSVVVQLRSEPIDLGTFSADGQGVVDVLVTLPADVAPGEHTLVISPADGAGGRAAAVPIVIEASPSGQLPKTGSSLAALLWLALAAAWIGVGLRLVGCRRLA